jgi:cytoskeletal protein CcmA (bactofilin family)
MAQPRSSSSSAAAHAAAAIGPGSRVRGRVTGDGDLTVHGRLEGEVQLRGSLFIDEGAHVEANVDADALRVGGTLEGNVSVAGDVTILSGARVRGDVRGASIALHEGGELDGRLDSEFTLPRELGGGGEGGDDNHKKPARR